LLRCRLYYLCVYCLAMHKTIHKSHSQCTRYCWTIKVQLGTWLFLEEHAKNIISVLKVLKVLNLHRSVQTLTICFYYGPNLYLITLYLYPLVILIVNKIMLNKKLDYYKRNTKCPWRRELIFLFTWHFVLWLFYKIPFTKRVCIAYEVTLKMSNINWLNSKLQDIISLIKHAKLPNKQCRGMFICMISPLVTPCLR
jgi:hypothetical protein